MEDAKISVIVSVFNEQEVLPYFHREMLRALEEMEIPFELIYVNDGSCDDSQRILEDAADGAGCVRVITFSKNFGHEAAMIAGIDHARGDFIVCIDADLEKPPSEVARMYEVYREGYDVVSMVYREDGTRKFGKQVTAKLYYKLINKISRVRFVENASDFFGVSRRVADVLREEYRERRRYIRGDIQSMGFRSAAIPYVPNKRYTGTSKYGFRSLFRLASSAVINFSDKPLQLGFYASAFCLLLTGIGGVSLVHDLFGGAGPAWGIGPAWGAGPARGAGPAALKLLAVLFLFLFAVMFFLIGILGIYLGDIQKECKRNPIYLVRDRYNFGKK